MQSVSDTVDDTVAWVRCNQDHHGIAFLCDGQSKVNHYCLDLVDWQAIKVMCDHLTRHQVPIIYGPSPLRDSLLSGRRPSTGPRS